jgi:hypothetical protein
MFKEIDEESVEAFAPPVFKVKFGVLALELGEQRPSAVTENQERSAACVLEESSASTDG